MEKTLTVKFRTAHGLEMAQTFCADGSGEWEVGEKDSLQWTADNFLNQRHSGHQVLAYEWGQ